MVLVCATLRTFDRCMGRVAESAESSTDTEHLAL
jgi:hypothetical protein